MFIIQNPYFYPYPSVYDSESFRVLHLNIISMKRNFLNFQEFFKDLKFNLSAICLSVTWCESIGQQNIPITNLMDNGYRYFHEIKNEH